MTAIIGKWAFSVDCFDQGEPRGSTAKHVQLYRQMWGYLNYETREKRSYIALLGSNGLRSIVDASPSTISSAIARPVAGPHKMPQQHHKR